MKISKFLSMVLRHRPQAIGVSLDENGWVEIDVLLTAMIKHGHDVDRGALDYIVRNDTKGRYEVEAERIRACQGHSIEVDLELVRKVPPDNLYHGTAEGNVSSILEDGLKRGKRNYVHLSVKPEIAYEVGRRRGRPVILLVDAKMMNSHQYSFFQSKNDVWLIDFVPPEYIRIFDP